MSVEDRCRAYLEKVPPSVSGAQGHNRLFHAAMIIVDRFGIEDEDTAYELLEEFNEKEGGDPEDERQLHHKLDSAFKKVEAQGCPSRDLVGDDEDDNTRDVPSRINSDDDTGTESDDILKNTPVNDPNRLADAVIASKFSHPDYHTLHYWDETWWTWRDSAYTKLNAKELDSIVTRVCHEEFKAELRRLLDIFSQVGEKKMEKPKLRPVTRELVGNVLGALRSTVQIPGSVKMPTWLGPKPAPMPPDVVIPAANLLVNLQSRATVPPTPRFFCDYSLGYNYDPNATAPTWLQFLADLWGDDHESIAALQQWFGYCLTTDTSLQKMLWVIGPSGAGKGTIGKILTRLPGPNRATAVALSKIEDRFSLAHLIGKQVCVVGEVRLGSKSNLDAISECILSVTGEDNQAIDRKHISVWEGRLTTKFTVMANHTPWFNDSSQALSRRLLVLQLYKT